MQVENKENKSEKKDLSVKIEQKSFLDQYPQINNMTKELSHNKNFNTVGFESIIKYFLENWAKQEDIVKYWKDFFNNLLPQYYDLFNVSAPSIILNDFNKIIKEETNETKEETKENKQVEIKLAMFNISSLYQFIPTEFKPDINSVEFQDFKNQNLSKVQDKLTSTSISIDEYMSNRYTAQKLSQSSATTTNKYEFIKSFNQLNKLLNIDIQIPLISSEKPDFKPLPDSLDDFQSKPDKILALSSVQDYIKTSPEILTDIDISQQDFIKFYADKIPQQIINILSQNKLDQNLIQYFNISDLNSKTWILDKSKISQITDQNLLTQLQQISSSIITNFTTQWKKEILTITNKSIKEKIMSSVFRWISDFFDITNDNIENFASDFKLDFNQDLNLTNNIINIKWQINWSYVWLHYDLINWKLSMDDVVSFDPINKLYKLWNQSWSLLAIPINLPELNDFQSDALKFNYKNLAKKSENLDLYQAYLNKQLWWVFDWKFTHKQLNQYYIRQLNEKNLAVQSWLSYMFNNFKWSVWVDPSFDFYWSQTIAFTQDLHPDHFRLIKIIDDSFDYYNKSDNFLQIRNLFEKFNMLINTQWVKQWNKWEELINKLFNDGEMSASANAWKSMWNKWNFNYLRFYDLISKSKWDAQIIDIDILENVINVLDKWEKFTDKDNKKKFNSSFRDQYEKITNDSDENLAKELKSIN